VLDMVVVRPRFVARKPRGQRLGRLRPVHDRERDQRKSDDDGEPNEQTVALHRPSLVKSSERGAENKFLFPSHREGLAAGTAARVCARERPADSLGRPLKPKGAPEGALWFAESISLSSTGSADLRLPPTAFASGFDLLALRARRRQESRRGQVLPQEVRKTKRAQFAEIQFSTFPQQTLQLVESAAAR
jgi:hypothetical protein